MTTGPDDILLWESFRKGDRDAFAALFRKYYGALYRYGGKFTTDHQLLEDCIQELFVELWRANSRTPVTSVRSYLLKSLKYKLLRVLRKKRDLVRLQEADSPFEWSHETFLIAAQEGEEKRKRVLKAVEQLTPRQKEIVYLKYYQDLNYEEVGEIMNINYQVARNLLCQAMKTLKNNITLPLMAALFEMLVG